MGSLFKYNGQNKSGGLLAMSTSKLIKMVLNLSVWHSIYEISELFNTA